MNEGIRKFRELFLTDEEFQQKLKAAATAYTGEQTEEAIFNGMLVPLAEEYGISVSYDEYHAFLSGDLEMNNEELMQVAGGTKGAGATICFAIGIGAGLSEDDDDNGVGGSLCAAVGIGAGGAACMGDGAGF